MRRNLFKKANYLLPKVKIISETDFSVRLEVISSQPHEVSLKYQQYQMILSCSCTHNANKPNELCSHKIAALAFLVNTPDVLPTVEVIETKPMETIFDEEGQKD
jgi:hypothetical protein